MIKHTAKIGKGLSLARHKGLYINPNASIAKKKPNANNASQGVQPEDQNIFSQFQKWQTMHDINSRNYNKALKENEPYMDAYSEALGIAETNPEYLETEEFLTIENEYYKNDAILKQEESKYNSLEEEIGKSYDFMEGKNPANESEYNAQVHKFAKLDFEDKDTNGDNGVSFEEYFISESADGIKMYKEMIANGEISKEDAITSLAESYLMSQAVFKIIDSEMGNGDNKLDTDELAQYYTHLDEYQGKGDESTVRDGKFDIDLVSKYPEYLANQLLQAYPPSQQTMQSAMNIAETLLKDKAA